jgi:parallel beta-helix repeat protein
MIREAPPALILVLVLCWLFWMGVSPPEATASNSHFVHNRDTGLSYQSIQEAIDANETLDGHAILVDAGTPTVTPIVVNKPVSLVGEDRDSTVVQSERSVFFPYLDFPTVVVNVDNVTISGFTVRDGYHGIDLRGNHAHIVNCRVSNNTIGIHTGGYSSTFGGNIIEENVIINNVGVGISLYTNDDTVCNNIVAGNDVGINLFNTSDVVIWGNTIENNQEGCRVSLSSSNRIFHNNFLNNTVQALTNFPPGPCNWDNGYPSGGNYWSNYNGTDANGDGIGDTPFIIDEDNIDRYPLMMLIPEYPTSLAFSLLIITALLASAICRKKALKIAVLVKKLD